MYMKVRISGIIKESVVDGPGLRLVVFTQGCPHHCPECHNPNTHDPQGGYEISTEDIAAAIHQARLIRGVTFSGGEPFLQPVPLAHIAKQVKAKGLNVVTYSGYEFEQLLAMSLHNAAVKELLLATDILIDGPYKAAERDLRLAFRGSANQRLIDVPASLRLGNSVLWQEKKILGNLA